jgi:hypothetical protein
VNAGIPPERGKSRLIIETYRVGPDGRRVGGTRRRTVLADPDPGWVADSLAWPPCRCPRCRTGRAREGVQSIDPCG